MSKRIRLILEAEEYAKMEYPKPGQPLRNLKTGYYQPHIIESSSVGKYPNFLYSEEVDAWEQSLEIIGEIKRNRKILTKSGVIF